MFFDPPKIAKIPVLLKLRVLCIIGGYGKAYSSSGLSPIVSIPCMDVLGVVLHRITIFVFRFAQNTKIPVVLKLQIFAIIGGTVKPTPHRV